MNINDHLVVDMVLFGCDGYLFKIIRITFVWFNFDVSIGLCGKFWYNSSVLYYVCYARMMC